MLYFCYWARDPEGVSVSFVDDRFYDIGDVVVHNGEAVTIYDYTEEYDYAEIEEDF